MNILCRLSLSVLLSVCGLSAFCQSISSINSLIGQIDQQRQQLPVEKLYLQLDKSAYIQNDTIWFKAYLLNADYLTASTRSGLLYIELADNNNQTVKRVLVPVINGLSWGNIALPEDAIPEGSYTLRAYTNWMRNFGDDYIFKKSIYIASIAAQSHLIATDFKLIKQAETTNLQAAILFTDLNKTPIRLQDMQLRLTDGKHLLQKVTASTGVDGKIITNFSLPANASTHDLSIIIHDVTKKTEDAKTYIVPVILNQPQNTDLQFMPEGGTLVAGITSHIGFKAINQDGKGVNVSGKIVNSRHEEITTFESAHLGIGSFELTPLPGDNYSAELTLLDGSTKSYPLPSAHLSGICLQVSNRAKDSLKLIISVTPNLINSSTPITYYLIGQSRGIVCYAARITLKGTELITPIPKNAFPTGIAHFTLFNTANQPLIERIIYIDHQDNLQLNITANKKTYAPHDSIALNIKVTGNDGKPIRGSFSMAVTDDSQVKIDSITGNMANNLLLTSDIKGTIEQPGYYFQDNTAQRVIDLDNLLLTQGWVGYGWKEVFNPKPIEYVAEQEYTVQGKVSNIFNKPVANSRVVLLSVKPMFAIDTITSKDGRFVFKGFLPVDTTAFMIQARNKRGKSNNVGITIDDFKPPVFAQTNSVITPWYVNSDTLLLHNINNKIIKRQQEEKLEGLVHVLKTVNIRDKKIIKTSKNLNGPGEADQIFDQLDMEKAGKMSLEALLRLKVKGLYEGYMRHSTTLTYKINDAKIYFVIDGLFLDRFFSATGGDPNEYYHYIKDNLDYFTAEDITGIEVMRGPRYSSTYVINFLNPALAGSDTIAFIEITTRGGHGPFTQTTPGTYLYKPLAVTLPKQFYKPKYTIKTVNTGADLRSTIHWEPNIITDTAGKATVSFYSADKAAGYTIIIEGTDLNGSIGFNCSKISVQQHN